MKFLHVIVVSWLLTIATVLGQPAPILRNAWSTNTAGQTVRGNSDLSISNATTSLSYTQWWFYGVFPNTVARLTDVSNIVSTASGAASNAVSTIQSNGVTITTMATNINFVDSPTVTVLMTNSPSGKIHVSFQATSGGSGETNYNGEVFTNATFIGLVFDKVNNTNRLRSVRGGSGILVTNNGTNLVFAIDPSVVASQTDLNAASNILRTDITNLQGATNGLDTLVRSKQNGSAVLTNLVGTVANNVTNIVSLSTTNATSKPLTNSYTSGVLTLRGLEAGTGISLTANASNYVISSTGSGETNWNGDAGITNATRIGLADGKSNNTNLIKTLQAGNGIVLTNEVGGTNVRVAIDPSIVATQTDLNSVSNVFRTDVSNLQGSTNFNQTNIISLSTTNAISKPLTNSYVNGLLVLRGLEAGSGVTLTANASNYVIAATGGGGGSLAVQTNRTNLGTETNLNFITGNAISIAATNLSGSNDIQFNFTTFIDITSPPWNAKGDGVTDDTLAFQNACTNVGANIAVPYRAAGYLITNVFVTNGVTLFGAGGQSKLIFKPGVTQYMFDGSKNGAITFRNLELYGTNDATSFIDGHSDLRAGIKLFAYASNSKLQNLYVHGFGDTGVNLTSTNTSSSTVFTLTSNNVSVFHCDFRRNQLGLSISSAEYVKVSDCRAWECATGFFSQSASTLFTGCESFLNNIGFEINGAGVSNDGHGVISGCIINHNNNPLFITGIGFGFLVDGCQIWQGTNAIGTSTGIIVQNCQGSITRWACNSMGGECWVRNNVWFSTYGNTIVHSAGDATIFSENTGDLGEVIGEHGLYAKSNVTFQGNVSHTNATGTNYIVGYQHVNRMIVSNSLGLLNFNPQIGSVWTCTNATTGEGYWSTNRGFIKLKPQSVLFPTNSPPGLDQGSNNTWRLLFDDTALETGYWQEDLPDMYYTNATATITYSTLAAAASKSNCWKLACMVVKTNTATVNVDAYNGEVLFTNQVPATAGFTGRFTISCNLTSAVAGDFIKFRLIRDGTNSFDNNTGDTAIHDIRIQYDKKGL